VFVTPQYFHARSYLGGGERYPLNLAQGLVAEGAATVEIVAFGDEEHHLGLAPGLTLRVLQSAKRGKNHNPLDSVSGDLPDAIRYADIVHIHQAFTRTGELTILLGRLLRKTIFLTDHGGFTSQLGAQVGMLELVDRIVAQSQFAARWFDTTTPIDVIPGGVNGSYFAPPTVPVSRDRLLFAGRLLPHKGIDRLLKALPRDVPLTVCGRPLEADYYDHLQSLARGRDVAFITDADDATLRDLYRRAWATIAPSVYRDCNGFVHPAPELMGLTILESMACGTPAICRRVGGMPEFVDDGVTGFVFDSDEQLTDLLRQMSGNDQLALGLGEKARTMVETQYDQHLVAARVAASYRHALDHPAEGRP